MMFVEYKEKNEQQKKLCMGEMKNRNVDSKK